MANAKIINYGQQISAGTTAIPDNTATALDIESTDGKDYIVIDTTDGSEKLTLKAASSIIQTETSATAVDVLEVKAAAGDTVAKINTTNTNGGEIVLFRGGSPAINFDVNGGTYFNNPGLGVDFRVESDNKENAFLVDGSEDSVSVGGGGCGAALTDSGGTASVSTSGSSTALVGVNTAFETDFHVGAAIKVGTVTTTVTAITDNNNLTLEDAINTSSTGTTCTRDSGELFAVKTGDSKSILSVNATGVLGLSTEPDAGTGSAGNNLGIGDPNMFDAVTTMNRMTVIGNCRSNNAYSFVTGDSCVIIGFEAGHSSTAAQNSVFVGSQCADGAANIDQAVVIGQGAGQNAGDHTVHVGFAAGQGSTGQHNVSMGSGALSGSSSGSNNVAIGRDAMSAFTGSDSVGIGKEALDATSSTKATVVGYQALTALTATTEHNTAIGYQSGLGLDDGNQCVFLGSTADTTDVDGDNQIAIGYGAVCDAPNKIMMGKHRSVDMTMDCPPITVKQTSTSGAGITLEHEGSTGTIAFLGEDGDGGWMQLSKAGTAEVKFLCSGSSFVNSDSTRNFGVGLASPTATMHVGGSLAHSYSTPSGNITAGSAVVYHCNTASNDVTVTLPAKSGIAGRVYTFKKIHTDHNMIIDADGSETIDGVASLTFGDIYDSVTIQCGTAGWYIISRYEP